MRRHGRKARRPAAAALRGTHRDGKHSAKQADTIGPTGYWVERAGSAWRRRNQIRATGERYRKP
ncbi:hypothetical protein GCM10010124_03530 [Pilimelia terevasa]|uniref:Uncharacterized protein n=1 Tax=Pilimelia terevasa TaxID=53372 RepID=A0A8J3FFU0_9ACTN|nr:hypothetical protein GCM10010124_03530 [Pilimelia terevasa]